MRRPPSYFNSSINSSRVGLGAANANQRERRVPPDWGGHGDCPRAAAKGELPHVHVGHVPSTLQCRQRSYLSCVLMTSLRYGGCLPPLNAGLQNRFDIALRSKRPSERCPPAQRGRKNVIAARSMQPASMFDVPRWPPYGPACAALSVLPPRPSVWGFGYSPHPSGYPTCKPCPWCALFEPVTCSPGLSLYFLSREFSCSCAP